MTQPLARDAIYRRRVIDADTIELSMKRYISYRLSYRDLVEMMAQHGAKLRHTAIPRSRCRGTFPSTRGGGTDSPLRWVPPAKAGAESGRLQ